MNKKVFLIGMLLGTLPLGVAAQEVLKPDTIHTELRSDFFGRTRRHDRPGRSR